MNYVWHLSGCFPIKSVEFSSQSSFRLVNFMIIAVYRNAPISIYLFDNYHFLNISRYISVDRAIISIKFCLVWHNVRSSSLIKDVGCHLLKFLDGIDATINFLEAVNDSRQFWSIAKTSDYHFIEMVKGFCGHQRILLPCTVENFTDECEIDDGRLMVVSKHYSDVIEPVIFGRVTRIVWSL
jgi:hypothetical protein